MKSVLVAGIIALTITPTFAKPHGDALQFSIKEPMTNNEIEPSAAGNVQASQSQQGNANKQKLDVTVSGLTPNSPYSVFASTIDDNTLTDIADFTTDKKGKAKLHFNSKSSGKKNLPLPVNSVSHLLEMDVVNADSQAVLIADIRDPQSIKYMIKRDISANDVTSSLQIKSTKKKTQFLLTASGLTPDTDYLLVLNGVPVQTNTSDDSGNLRIDSAPLPDNILDLQSVALTDTANNEIVSTTLP
jgi:hypothetical protein